MKRRSVTWKLCRLAALASMCLMPVLCGAAAEESAAPAAKEKTRAEAESETETEEETETEKKIKAAVPETMAETKAAAPEIEKETNAAVRLETEIVAAPETQIQTSESAAPETQQQISESTAPAVQIEPETEPAGEETAAAGAETQQQISESAAPAVQTEPEPETEPAEEESVARDTELVSALAVHTALDAGGYGIPETETGTEDGQEEETPAAAEPESETETESETEKEKETEAPGREADVDVRWASPEFTLTYQWDTQNCVYHPIWQAPDGGRVASMTNRGREAVRVSCAYLSDTGRVTGSFSIAIQGQGGAVSEGQFVLPAGKTANIYLTLSGALPEGWNGTLGHVDLTYVPLETD